VSEGRAELQISLAEVISAKRRFFLRHQFVPMAILIAAMFTGFAVQRHYPAYIAFVEIAIFVSAWFVGFSYLYIPLDARSILKQPNFTGHIAIDWDDLGLTTRSLRGSNRLLWNQYWGWDATAQVLMLFIGKRSYQILPKIALQPLGVDRLLADMEAAGVVRDRRSPQSNV